MATWREKNIKKTILNTSCSKNVKDQEIISQIDDTFCKLLKYDDIKQKIPYDLYFYESIANSPKVGKLDNSIYDSEPVCDVCKHIMCINYEANTYICTECGNVKRTYLDVQVPKFNKTQNNYEYPNTMNYRKTANFTQALNRFQAKEKVFIPETVINYVLSELAKKNIEPMNATPKNITEVLKQNKRISSYNKHVWYICKLIGGIYPKEIPPKTMDELLRLYNLIQKNFKKVCVNNRKNTIISKYVMRKLFEILDEYEYASFVPLPSAKKNLAEMENTWSKICAQTGLTFIGSL
jgi:hypothetical protein